MHSTTHTQYTNPTNLNHKHGARCCGCCTAQLLLCVCVCMGSMVAGCVCVCVYGFYGADKVKTHSHDGDRLLLLVRYSCALLIWCRFYAFLWNLRGLLAAAEQQQPRALNARLLVTHTHEHTLAITHNTLCNINKTHYELLWPHAARFPRKCADSRERVLCALRTLTSISYTLHWYTYTHTHSHVSPR